MDQKLLAGAVTVIVLSVLIAVWLYYQIAYFKNTNVYYAKDTSKPIDCASVTVIKDDEYVLTSKCTASFWAYFSNYPSGTFSMLQIGNGNIKVPDGTTLLVTQQTNNVCVIVSNGQCTVSIPTVSGTNNTKAYRSITLPYIPSERWFQLALSFDDSSSTATVFLDGDKVSELQDDTLKLPSMYDIIIGSKNTAIEGVISTVGSADGILTRAELLREYRKGPVHTTTGLPYGLRSPFYKT